MKMLVVMIASNWTTTVDNLDLFILQSYSESDLDDDGVGSIRCCTEYHKYDANTDEKMIAIRCHPNFRGKGYAWYDWVIIRYEDADGIKTEFPSRVLSCVPRHSTGIDGIETITFDLIVQCCGERTGQSPFCSLHGRSRKTSILFPRNLLLTCVSSFRVRNLVLAMSLSSRIG